MADSTELESLEAFLGSDGWRLFHQHLVDEWGPHGARFQQAYKAALAQQATTQDAEAALNRLRAVAMVQSELEKLILWPLERIRAIQQQAPTISGPSRRGSL